jgi:nitrogen fixation protein NifU and related proteins
MSELRELYQEVILDDNKRPRNFRKLEDVNRAAAGHNPLCGDQFTVYLHLEGEVIRDISVLGSGCAIAKASASMRTDSVKGQTTAKVEALFDKVHRMLTEEHKTEADLDQLGKLAVLSGVWEFPARVKCARRAWHTRQAALKGNAEAVSTE